MKNTPIKAQKSSLSAEANVVSLIIYIAITIIAWISYIKYFAWALPIIFFIIERDSKFVKFNAVQAFFVSIIRAGIAALFSFLIRTLTPSEAVLQGMMSDDRTRILGISAFAGDVATFIDVGITVVVIYLMIMTYGYIQIGLPGIGQIARKVSKTPDDDDE